MRHSGDHSGSTPHHHHHAHHHKHEHRHGDPKQIGTVAHAVATILASVKALPDKRNAHLAIGHAMSNLIGTGHIDGVSDVLREVIHSTNRYEFLDET